MHSTTLRRLPLIGEGRLETQLPDGKPLYSPGEARAEAERCLYCHDAPCIRACPTSIDVPTFIKKIATGNVVGAARTILTANVLGYSCARVCPVEVLCAGSCVYNDWHREPIQIGKLQRFATEAVLRAEEAGGPKLFTPKARGPHSRKVALVGAGPASLACAAYLALEGHEAVIYEKRAVPGGLNATGVAPYKLHLHDAVREVTFVESLGVAIEHGVEVGVTVSAEDLLARHDAVFLGLGLGEDTVLGVEGEQGPGVFGATAFIEKMKTEPGFGLAGVRRAAVIGGGNTAIDVARELAKLGVEDVSMIYRRDRASMSGYEHEMDEARLEGVRLVERSVTVAILREEGRVTGLRLAHAGEGEGGEREVPCDAVFLAIGQSKLRGVARLFAGVELDRRGCVVVDETSRRTGHPKVYAGGDCINGGKEVVNAVADGREAAYDMMRSWAQASAAELASMADLSIDMCGIKSPNPFWLASAPPANTGEQVMRAFDAGWGGAVWKTLGNPIVNVSSRFGAIDLGMNRIAGFNNIELITDRPLETNLREIAEVKKRYPKHAVIVSLMVESKDEWRDIIRRSEDTGADGLELNFGCPHGMCERGMGSSVGQEPEVLKEITSWAREFARTPVLVKLTPNIGDILEPGFAAVAGGAHGLSLINTIKSIVGVDLERMVPLPRVGGGSTNGGYCGPAVKPIALHMVAALAREKGIGIPISGIGGVSTWRDAAEFIALGATSVQVCTAVMHYGYRIIDDLLEGLNNYLDQHGMKSVNDLRGRAVEGYKDWGELDLNYNVVAKIDASKCIGCQLCYVACLDGAHQCIHLPEGPCGAWHGDADHGKHARLAPSPIVTHKPIDIRNRQVRIPVVDERECIGCNLCALVCPVDDCISMVEVSTDKGFESWNDRVAAGRDKIPGGLHE